MDGYEDEVESKNKKLIYKYFLLNEAQHTEIKLLLLSTLNFQTQFLRLA